MLWLPLLWTLLFLPFYNAKVYAACCEARRATCTTVRLWAADTVCSAAGGGCSASTCRLLAGRACTGAADACTGVGTRGGLTKCICKTRRRSPCAVVVAVAAIAFVAIAVLGTATPACGTTTTTTSCCWPLWYKRGHGGGVLVVCCCSCAGQIK